MKKQKMGLAAAVALLLLAMSALAQADITQKGNLRVATSATMKPRALPRTGTAPIAVSVAGQISTTDESTPPQLKKLTIEINRHGRLDYQGLAVCTLHEIQPANNSRALSACRSALVGEGTFSADVVLRGQAPYPSNGRLLIFNGKEGGRQVLLGHIYATRPFTTSFVISFAIKGLRHGRYGTALVASLPSSLGSWGNVTGIQMTLRRRFHVGGRSHSFLSAGCPAPKGFPGAVFPLARTSFAFAGGRKLTSTLSSECRVR